ncbi:uncharacterized protein LOC143244678 [Tachypleus tridentatus]|uniref:uncharacterized protein LOC143244678 n=1 Tax=Tachypleus tridentatus TaxID=6853 RepID=UPI003FD50883
MTRKSMYQSISGSFQPCGRLGPATPQQMNSGVQTVSQLNVKKPVTNKDKKIRTKTLRGHDYKRLKSMVPAVAAQPKVSKVTVIEEAVRYIDHLHSVLLTRLKSYGAPQLLEGINLDINHMAQTEIRELVHNLVTNASCEGKQNNVDLSLFALSHLPAPTERTRRIPSYLLRHQRRRS